MQIKLHNVVIQAEQYEALVEWYMNAFGFERMFEERGGFHYTEVGMDGRVVVGITPAKEVYHTPSSPRNNSALMQLLVSDINKVFERVKEAGGKIVFGPKLEENDGFYYGAVLDIEGNQIWMFEEPPKQ